MDPTWQHPAVQVVINGHPQAQALSQVHHPGGPPQRRDRPLYVEEALQYSPMSSSPIFGLGEKTDVIDRPPPSPGK